MVENVNNAGGAVVALRSMQTAREQLVASEKRLSSGLKVDNARDDAVSFQAASAMRGQTASLRSVSLSLGRAEGVVDVALAAGEQISRLLVEMRGAAATAMAGDFTEDQRAAQNAAFQQQKAQLVQLVRNATFDDANLLDGSNPNGVSFIADADASQPIVLAGRNLLPGGAVVTLGPQNDLSSPSAASQAFEQIGVSLANVGQVLADMGDESKKIGAQITFVSRLADVLASGIGRMVDADLAEESALIQALQVRQTLSAQAVSIANSAPRALLSLFRG
jgi:flagellin